MRYIPPFGPGQRTRRDEKDENFEIRQATFWFFVGLESLMALACGLFFVPKLSSIMAAFVAALVMGLLTFFITRFWKESLVPWVSIVATVATMIAAYKGGPALRVWLADSNLEYLLLPAAVPAVLALVLLSYCMMAEAVDRNGPTPPRNAINWGGVIWPWTRIPSEHPWGKPPKGMSGQFSFHAEGQTSDGDYQSVLEGDEL